MPSKLCGLPNKFRLLSNCWLFAKASWNACLADVVVGSPFKLGILFEGILGKLGGKLGVWGIWVNSGNWAGKQAADSVKLIIYF